MKRVPSAGTKRTKVICRACGTPFLAISGTVRWRLATGKTPPIYCSRYCKVRAESGGESKEVPCAVCATPVRLPFSRYSQCKKNFCSYRCAGIGRRKGVTVSCAECGIEFYVAAGRQRRHKTFFHTNACRLKYQYRNNFKSWKGFIESSKDYRRLVDRIRKSEPYRKWKRAVVERDRACEDCGSRTELHAHHLLSLIAIVSDNDFDEARTLLDPRLVDTNNGVALCIPCHAVRHGMQSPAGAIQTG
jgi:hypothetical protein